MQRVVWRLPEGPAFTMVPLRFAAGEMRVTFAGPVNERPCCHVEIAGTAFEPIRPMACFGFEQAPAEQLADQPLATTTLMRMRPEGVEAVDLGAAPPGEVIIRDGAAVEIDPEGRVIQCTPVTLPGGVARDETGSLCATVWHRECRASKRQEAAATAASPSRSKSMSATARPGRRPDRTACTHGPQRWKRARRHSRSAIGLLEGGTR